ncbi:PREDICTED: calmodulin-binding protein 60 A-like [Nelumbo nucifera]|uniref:Calmodulin-binding protein 60 A-like n=1 Tax=Nelumbo nucifera TaxID=4432 RepID=A0A1U8AVM1_NELNU|nr:PREDICTED: calmodulin-binding protein 60 A-like [Nelumbo nucifera]XP_010272044.1 PREDICTED: calmodulin-binding protein 60 A-like [Nelumbo nucifera]
MIIDIYLFFSRTLSMSQKRQPEDGKVGSGGNKPDEKRRKVPALRSVVLEVVKMQAIQTILSTLEPLIRKVVKEEVEVALRKHLASIKQNCSKQVYPSTTRSLQLQFTTKLSLPVFTGTRIEGDECSAIKVALVDGLTGQVVDSGLESLAKVEIVVLEGDFEGDEEDNWTVEDFNNNIVREREGKRPLLTGDAFLNLNEGIGIVSDLVFTDNSSWTRSRKFRLGARVVDGNDGIRIREAKTEAFMVKDHRGELYKKHYPPSLLDEVWRLEKIGKDGAFHKRLRRENINTVKDFLTLLCIDASRLRNILGSGMSAKMWEVTVEHARTCTLDNQMYVYYPLDAQRRVGVVFNTVGQVMGLLSEQQYIPNDDLSETEKVDAQKLVKVAFEHWEEVAPLEAGSINGDSSHLSNTVCFPSSSPGLENSFGSKFLGSHQSGGFGFDQANATSPDLVSSILSIGGMRSLDSYSLQGEDSMDFRYDHPTTFASQVTTPLISDTESMAAFYGEDHLQYFDQDHVLQSQSLILDPQADLQSAVSGFLTKAGPPVKANTRWTMLYSLLRWRFSIRRIMASRKSRRVRDGEICLIKDLEKIHMQSNGCSPTEFCVQL